MEQFPFRRLLVATTAICLVQPASGQDAGHDSAQDGTEAADGPVLVDGYAFTDEGLDRLATPQDPLVPLRSAPVLVQRAGTPRAPAPVAASWSLAFKGTGGPRGGVEIDGAGSPYARDVTVGAMVDVASQAGQFSVASRSRVWSLGDVRARSSQQLVMDQPALLAPTPATYTLKHTMEVEMPWHQTALRLDSRRSSTGEVWLHGLEARQNLFGPIDLSARVEETSPTDTSMGFSTRLRLDW